MAYWKPNVTVAAVVERDGRLLMVEERTIHGLRLNQPAGHLDPGEALAHAVAREALEETGWTVEPVALLGVYMARHRSSAEGVDVTYLRHAFVCRAVSHDAARVLDVPVERALWMRPDEILAAPERHRSPLVARTVVDWRAGRRFPLDLLWTDPSALDTPPGAAS
ncbi:MAG TPA: NUDIX hydrolase [Burkholderiaceae bacterium]|nr:NUDIX hydrolase [Burkholderiaceae bacterium]